MPDIIGSMIKIRLRTLYPPLGLFQGLGTVFLNEEVIRTTYHEELVISGPGPEHYIDFITTCRDRDNSNVQVWTIRPITLGV